MGALVPVVAIKCPLTGRPLGTGVSPPEAFDRSELNNNISRCPHCDRAHTWSKSDAFVAWVAA